MTTMHRPTLPALLLLAGLVACGGGGAGGPASPAPEPEPEPVSPPAPWSAPAIDAPPVYADQWRQAENRGTCAALAFASPGEVGPAGEPRAATFSGGWAVAYDVPGLRSAYGVAGTGVEVSADTYDDWPYWQGWADGSSAGYGPEGGSGEKQLAYLQVAGQRCLYNVWSNVGRVHLERLLERLRFVRGAGAP